MSDILVAKNLQKIYGGKNNSYRALNDISFSIEEGEFIGIMGPSGAGKTTLLNILSTIDIPTSGEVVFDGVNISNMNEEELTNFRKDKLGFIFQDYNLLDTLTLKENIILPLSLSKVDLDIIEDNLIKVSKSLMIDDLLDKYPYEVSIGQKQRASAARAFITSPSLIMADEPTGALDSKSSTMLLSSLEKLNKENNSTIMMVTHDAFSASYCKRILFIKDGAIYTQITKDGSRKEFFSKIIDVLRNLGGDLSDLI
ncbi:ABC transporter ATP-binding protein [Peptostreptococcaceae bacterium AGR-M142]